MIYNRNIDLVPMKPTLLVVARGPFSVDRFQERTLLEAINTRDFLEQTGDYEEVSIFQALSGEGPLKEWVELKDLDP